MEQPLRLNFRLRDIYALALPVILGQVGMMTLLMVDTVMVGQLGAVELAAMGLGSTLFLSFLLFGSGCLVVIEAVSSWSIDQEQDHQAWLVHSFALVILLSLGLGSLAFFASEILPLINIDSKLLTPTKIYLDNVQFCLFPYFAFFGLRQFLAGEGRVRAAALIIIIANFFNALFNWVFIYGKYGFPAYGIKGAAIATVLTRFVMLAGILFYCWRIGFKFPKAWKLNTEKLKKLIRLALT